MKLFNKSLLTALMATVAFSGHVFGTQKKEKTFDGWDKMLIGLAGGSIIGGAYKTALTSIATIGIKHAATPLYNYYKAREIFDAINAVSKTRVTEILQNKSTEKYLYATSWLTNDMPLFYIAEKISNEQNVHNINELKDIFKTILNKTNLKEFKLSDRWQYEVNKHIEQEKLHQKANINNDLARAMYILKQDLACKCGETDKRVQTLSELINLVNNKGTCAKREGFWHWMSWLRNGVQWNIRSIVN
jgi:hypothetical protein